MIEAAKCTICGEPMPQGEEMFKFHGYSGPCPKPPLLQPHQRRVVIEKEELDKKATDLSNFIDGMKAPDAPPAITVRNTMTTITIERAVVHRALSALEYHTQQTRPIHNTELVIEELRDALSGNAPATAPDEQLRKDAERYQWLRKTTNWVSSKGQRINVRDFPKSWDEHIDDAMKDNP